MRAKWTRFLPTRNVSGQDVISASIPKIGIYRSRYDAGTYYGASTSVQVPVGQ